MLAGQLAGKAGMLGSIVVLSRYMSDVSFGRLTLAVALGQVAFFMSDMGVSLVANRMISRSPNAAESVFARAATLRVLLGLSSVALLLLLGLFGGYSEQQVLFFGVLGFAAFFRSSAEVTYSVFRGRERMVYEGITRSSMGIFSFLLAIAVVALDLGNRGAAGVYLARALLGFSLGLLFLGRVGVSPRLAPLSSRGELRKLLASSLPLGIMGLLFIAYQRLDNLLIQAILGDAAVGAYQESFRLLELMILVVAPTLLPGALFPGLCRSYADGWEGTARRVRDMAEAFLAMAAVLTIPVYVGGARLMRLVWGESFLRGQTIGGFTTTLYLLMATLPMYYMMHLLLATILASDRQRITALAAGAAVAASIAGNILLLPRLGLPAAGIMAFASTSIIVLIFYRELAVRHSPLPLWRALPRPAAAVGLGVAVALIANPLPLPARMALASLSTGGCWLATGGLSLLRRVFSRHGEPCTAPTPDAG